MVHRHTWVFVILLFVLMGCKQSQGFGYCPKGDSNDAGEPIEWICTSVVIDRFAPDTPWRTLRLPVFAVSRVDAKAEAVEAFELVNDANRLGYFWELVSEAPTPVGIGGENPNCQPAGTGSSPLVVDEDAGAQPLDIEVCGQDIPTPVIGGCKTSLDCMTGSGECVGQCFAPGPPTVPYCVYTATTPGGCTTVTMMPPPPPECAHEGDFCDVSTPCCDPINDNCSLNYCQLRGPSPGPAPEDELDAGADASEAQ